MPFNDNSFTATNQVVDLSGLSCNNMIWTEEAGTKKPSVKGGNPVPNINVYGSLELAAGMLLQAYVSIKMLGTSQSENAQYIKYNGSGFSRAYYSMLLSGGGRYDLLSDMLIGSDGTAWFSIDPKSSFYSHGHTINGKLQIQSGGSVSTTIDLKNSTLLGGRNDGDYNISIDDNRTLEPGRR